MKEKINFEGKKNSFIKKSLDILSLCGEVFGDVMKWKEKEFSITYIFILDSHQHIVWKSENLRGKFLNAVFAYI